MKINIIFFKEKNRKRNTKKSEWWINTLIFREIKKKKSKNEN